MKAEVFGAEHEHAPGPKLAAPLEKNLDLDTIRVSTNNFSKQNIIASNGSRTIYKVSNFPFDYESTSFIG